MGFRDAVVDGGSGDGAGAEAKDEESGRSLLQGLAVGCSGHMAADRGRPETAEADGAACGVSDAARDVACCAQHVEVKSGEAAKQEAGCDRCNQASAELGCGGGLLWVAQQRDGAPWADGPDEAIDCSTGGADPVAKPGWLEGEG